MKLNTFKSTLPILLKHDIVPFVWGMQGIGKTESVKQVAESLDIGFVHLHLATQEVGDVVGLLKENFDGKVEHMKPTWFPESGEGIVFLDELNRAHPDVLQAMFSFITSKTIHTHKLPNGWKIVAAGNYQSDDFQVTDTSDSAWMSRFCHIELKPTPEEFVVYAESKGALTVAEFIQNHPEMLEVSKRAKIDINITPDRRSWLNMLAKLEDETIDTETRVELYSGIVGTTAAASFMNAKKEYEKKISIKQIVADYSKVRPRIMKAQEGTETRFDLLNAPINELEAILETNASYLDQSKYDNLVCFLEEIPLELLMKTVKRLSKIEFELKYNLLSDDKLVKRFL